MISLRFLLCVNKGLSKEHANSHHIDQHVCAFAGQMTSLRRNIPTLSNLNAYTRASTGGIEAGCTELVCVPLSVQTRARAHAISTGAETGGNDEKQLPTNSMRPTLCVALVVCTILLLTLGSIPILIIVLNVS